MVLDFYNLNEQPFGVTPDPRFLYLSPTHREALASVQYGVTAGRGFTALIARPGMGKTTLLFDFLSKVPIPAKTVFLFQSKPTPRDLLRNLIEDLGVQEESDDIGHIQGKLNESLVSESKKGNSVVVVVEEAQNLDEKVYESRHILQAGSKSAGLRGVTPESLFSLLSTTGTIPSGRIPSSSGAGTIEVPLAQAKILGALVNDGTSPIPESRY